MAPRSCSRKAAASVPCVMGIVVMSKPDGDRESFNETVDMWNPGTIDEEICLDSIRLTVQHGFLSGDPPRIPVGEKMTVGRTSDADFQAPLDDKVSRVHFSIQCRDHCGVVCDLGSRNGTFVNGQRIDSETRVHDGDQIAAGATILLVQLVSA